MIVGSLFFGTAPLVRVDPETGAITPSTTEVGELDDPTSLAFVAARLDRKSIDVLNADLFSDDQPGTGPGVVRVGVGVPGAPTR
ncbi:MAG TPA: hypothetical protein VFG78_10800 [Gemmatimonadota bacterium]|nr:hypothetical protein [Gemmatimonadota bacterium]